MPNSLSELHTLHAWEDNQITERCTQGEYAGKVLQFKLVDKDGIIDLTNCLVQYAVTRPDKTEDLLDCTVDNGVVKCNLTYSATSISGLVHGEVRVIGSNDSGIIKFYGVNLRVYKGVSDEAAEQSDEFTALIAALQKVATVNPDGSNTVTLDSAIVENGTNPVASGVIYAALQVLDNAKIDKDKAVKYTGSNDLSECVDNGVLYRVHDGTTYQILLCNSGDAYRVQYMFKRSGEVVFRTSAKSNDTWGAWSTWSPIGTTSNIADGAVTTAKVADDLAAVINAKEEKSNKKTTLTGNESSNDYYPTTKAVADALSTKAPASTAYTFDSTTTNVVYNVANPKIIYTNAVVNGKNAFVLTTADNYYQIALCYDGTEYKRELTAGGSTTYNPWLEVQNSDFDTFEIECYERVESSGQERQNIDLSFTAGSYPKATHNTVSLETGITDIKYAVTSVVPGETIHVHCMNNWMARAYLFADSSGKGLSWFPENSISPTLYDTDVVVPENAATMYIMGELNTDVYAYRVIQVPVVTTFTLDVDELMEKITAPQSNNLTVNISNGTLSVTNSVNTITAGLHTSHNKGFSFSNIYGKTAVDDVCPVRINSSYVGGNHGFTANIVVTNSNGHGKTIADIGSVYKRSDVPGMEYVIVNVPNTTTLWLIRRDGTMEYINPSLSFTFTHVSGGVNTDPISFSNLQSFQQLVPGINNIDLSILADDTTITSGETTCKQLKIVESYNIISLAEIANYLINNVGQNDNTSYYNNAIAGIAKRTTVYNIMSDMSITVSDYLQSLDTFRLNSMGVVQSQRLGSKFLAPYTTYSGIQNIESNVIINEQVWSIPDVPPHKIYQLDETNGIKGQLMLYPPFGLGETDKRVDALGSDGVACTIDHGTKKFYPIFYGKNIEIATGTLIGGYAIRTPFEFDENGIFSFVYQIAGKTYAEIECLESGDYYASVGTKYSVIRNTIAKQNIVLNTETIIDGKVYFHCTGNGSITLEIA